MQAAAPDLSLWEGLLRLGLAALLAGAIGVERELLEVAAVGIERLAAAQREAAEAPRGS